MSLRRNILANYAGQLYAAALSLAVLPLYLRVLGQEAFGLIGFLAMLQAWSSLLDAGLSPTLSRDFSRLRAGELSAADLVGAVRSVELLFAALGLLAATFLGFGSGWVAQGWLRVEILGHGQVVVCLICMGLFLGTRWLTGLYRAALTGLEQMVPLNVAAAVVATLRSLGGLSVALVWPEAPERYFIYQVVIAAFELAVLGRLFRKVFPMAGAGWRWVSGSMRSRAAMAGGMAFLAGIWIVLSQADKLILSGLLALSDYGLFMVAVSLAGGITLLAAPLVQVMQSRLIVLHAQGRTADLQKLYRLGTEITTVLCMGVAGILWCFPEKVLVVWTGDAGVGGGSGPVLAVYAVGNGLAALLAMAFAYQFAHGRLRWHVLGNLLFAVAWLPGIYWGAERAGAHGVGVVWLCGNLAYLLMWLPWIHGRLSPGLWWRWLLFDVVFILCGQALPLVCVGWLDWREAGRFGQLGLLALLAVCTFIAGVLAGNETRAELLRLTRSFLAQRKGPGLMHRDDG